MSTRDTCPHCACAPPLQATLATEIIARTAEIDPEGIEDWGSLIIGWALSKGLTPNEAKSFSWHIRYHTDLA